MDADVAQELLNELGSALERLETQQGALLQFLKEKNIVPEAELAPYLAQAGKTSNVRWVATRVRMERIISSSREKQEKQESVGTEKTEETVTRPEGQTGKKQDPAEKKTSNLSKADAKQAEAEEEQDKNSQSGIPETTRQASAGATEAGAEDAELRKKDAA
ncbi:MAG TPA: hypothetical protein VND65_06955 [Candidatus Binatia bacterium]|nr:hypothetical protein [Candidatus Binatia bacterium]